MSLSITTSKVKFTGNGVTVAFAFTFKAFADADIDVYLIDSAGALTQQTISTHYTLSRNSGEGGTVTFLTAPTSTQTVLIIRASSYTQDTDLEAEENFPEDTIEARFDKLTTFVHELSERIDRKFGATMGTAFANAAAAEINTVGSGGEVLAINEAETALTTLTAADFFDIEEGSISAQMDGTMTNNQAATALGEFVIDGADYTSAILFTEIRRTTSSVTIVSYAMFWLRYVSSSWEIEDSTQINRSGVAHGVTLTINTASGVGTVSAATSNLAGTDHTGTIKGKMLRLAV